MVSLGRRLLNLAQRPQVAPPQPLASRPFGPLVWLHLPAKAPTASLLELARRLIEEDGVQVLVTSTTPLDSDLTFIWQPAPADQTSVVAAFLQHWSPEAVVMFDGEIWPLLIQTCNQMHIPSLMVEAHTPRLIAGRETWFINQMRTPLAQVSYIATLDHSAERAFRKAGAPSQKMQVLGRLEELSATLPYLEAERESLSIILRNRPLWLAACLPKNEEAAVLEAHHAALAYNHRLLLILLPEQPERGPELAQKLRQANWTVAERAQEEEPEEDDMIYIVNDASELGLWYRMAPVCFLGGSLSGNGALRHPFEPAALGSAILHGPRPGPHGSAFGRLGAARGAKAVASARDLSEALADLMSPEKVARLAQAAWDVSSEGAEATEAIMERLRNILDGVA